MSGIRPFLSSQNTQQRRLAAPIRPNQPYPIADINGERYVLKNGIDIVRFREMMSS
jgi:hypothetical protein